MPDPDLEIKEGGDAGLPTKFFWSFGPQFGPKIRGGAAPPGSATATFQQTGPDWSGHRS